MEFKERGVPLPKTLAAVSIFIGLLASVSCQSGSDNGSSAPSPAEASSQSAKVTLDNRPTYKGLKPPVKSFDNPGSEVRELRLASGRVYVGQSMLKAGDILPTADHEDAEDDPEITITSPFGKTVGMTYVYRYSLPDGRTVVIRYRRKVPHRPYVGEAGAVQHPFVVHSIRVQG